MHREFLRCEDVFSDFERAAHGMIMQAQRGEEADKYTAFHTYNCYSRFILQLIRVLCCRLQREKCTTHQVIAEAISIILQKPFLLTFHQILG